MTLKEIFEELNQTGFSSLNKSIVNRSEKLDSELQRNNQTAKSNTITTKQGVDDKERITSVKKTINGINDILNSLMNISRKLGHGETKNFGNFKEAISRLKDKNFSKMLMKNGYTELQLKQMSCIPAYKSWAEKTKEVYNNSSADNEANKILVNELNKLILQINSFEEKYSSIKTEENYFPY